MDRKFIIFTDGASRGNPGPAAASFIIQDQDGLIWVQDAQTLGINTNNFAEYTAVKLALQRILKDFSSRLPVTVEFKGDSMLITSQLSGKYKIKNEILKTIYTEIKELEKKVGEVSYEYTPRANNFLADKLANQALDNEL